MERLFRPAMATSWLSARRAVNPRPVVSAYRCLHNSPPRTAMPSPHPTVPGPPPQPPQATEQERLARKKKQAELLQKSRALKTDPAKPAQALRKRFWKESSVKDTPAGLQVMLDSRPVRTANKATLTLPPSKRPLAMAIALEWDLLVTAQQALKQHYIPLTSLASRAIDIAIADGQGNADVRDQMSTMLMRYLATDTLLCWAPERNLHDAGLDMDRSNEGKAGVTLRQKQMDVASPILSFLTTHLFPGVEIHPVLGDDSIMPTPQPAMTREVIKGWIAGLPAFELAGLERAVLATKSLLVAIRLVVEWSEEYKHLQAKGTGDRFGVAQAAEACSVEVTWQTNMWGEVEDSHDVDKEDLARQLGSVILLVN